MDANNDIAKIHNNDMENKITEAFDLFDHERNKTIDFRELGTVVRAIGGVPSEAEVLQMVREVSRTAFIKKYHTLTAGERSAEWLYKL
ncbi:EF-hand calcium-binding domain-containing protein 2 [Clonorchis sinensis]|uniref:EF-hand calcium-binding domain-containing protein 2 n=1 Tax=Clonorchis sinensis TaxID=79923 RepID=G7Y339_CLOSI|nr:EF-hand calcium-binding domain-containing protein 2 [Clonorchis sinensis]